MPIIADFQNFKIVNSKKATTKYEVFLFQKGDF